MKFRVKLILLGIIISSCQATKENIIVDKMINRNYCIGHSSNDPFFGLYKFRWSFSENISKDTVIIWDQIGFTSDNIFLSTNYIIIENKGKRASKYNVYKVINDSTINKIQTSSQDSFFAKYHFYNITDSIKKNKILGTW